MQHHILFIHCVFFFSMIIVCKHVILMTCIYSIDVLIVSAAKCWPKSKMHGVRAMSRCLKAAFSLAPQDLYCSWNEHFELWQIRIAFQLYVHVKVLFLFQLYISRCDKFAQLFISACFHSFYVPFLCGSPEYELALQETLLQTLSCCYRHQPWGEFELVALLSVATGN